MKKILVTGGAGFIGSNLCKRLLNVGAEVFCLDNLYTGKKSNISKLLRLPNFEFILHDITLPIFLEVDEIYHLACPASPVQYQKNPVQTIKTSVLGTINVLGLAKRTKARVLQASTSEIYGDPTVHPQEEHYWGNVNPVGIRSCYDEGKRCAETLCMDYKRQYDVNVKIVRIFNTYGPKMDIDDGRVVSNFIVQALKNENITVYGDGSQSRSFCYIDDLINAFLKVMNDKDTYDRPMNIGNPNEFSINELVKRVINLTNSKSQIEHKKLPLDDPKRRKPDIEFAKQKLKWEPKTELENGLEKTIIYFKQILESQPNSDLN